MLRALSLFAVGYLVFIMASFAFQRKLLYFPTHHNDSRGLAEWRHNGRLIGFAREVVSPVNVWLMTHGNGGQASDRVYAISAFSPRDSVFILEYPGYGRRPGTPSREAFNSAAKEAYELLRARFPNTPVCVVAESIGSGPAAALASNPHPPDKIVLIAPFDVLSRVAAHHFPYLPVKLFLSDDWNNIEALKGYRGPLQIFGARDDTVIPIIHSKRLADSVPTSQFREIEGGHNDWATPGRVKIRNP